MDFRSQMPVAPRWAYFDHAAVAPLSGPAQQRLRVYADEAAEQGDVGWTAWAREVEETRRRAARLWGSTPEEICFVPNTTAGIGLIAEGLPWQPGESVVTLANEFPSNLYPWMHLGSRGVETIRVTPDADGRWSVDTLLDACGPRTRLIAVSWVGYASGFRCDLEELVERAHQRGLLVLLDAIQGMGVFPLDVSRTGVDFVAADGHKWMLGPEGAGVLFIRREHLERLRPLFVGWNSVRAGHDFGRIELELRDTAARYEGGSQNMPGVLALGASLELLEQVGLAEGRVAERVLTAVRHLDERLTEVGAEVLRPAGSLGSGILSWTVPGVEPIELRQRLLAAEVVVSCRGGRVRTSPHGYANEDDIGRLVDVVRASAAARG